MNNIWKLTEIVWEKAADFEMEFDVHFPVIHPPFYKRGTFLINDWKTTTETDKYFNS